MDQVWLNQGRQFIEEAQKLIQVRTKGVSLLPTLRRDDGVMRALPPSPREIIACFKQEVFGLPGTRKFLDVVAGRSKLPISFTAPSSPGQKDSFLLDMYLVPLLERTYANDPAVEAELARLAKALDSGKMRPRVLAYIPSVKLPRGRFKLTDNLHIIPSTTPDLPRKLLHGSDDDGCFLDLIFSPSKAMPRMMDIKGTVLELTTALSVYMKRNMHPTSLTLMVKDPYPAIPSETIPSFGKWVPTAIPLEPVIEDEFFPFLLTFNELRKNITMEYIIFATKKLNASLQEDDLYVRISDLLMGLQALFVGSEDEVVYHTSIRTAIFLGRNLSERNLIFESVKAGYLLWHSVQSRMEIGELEVAGKSVSPEDVPRFLTRYVLESLRNMITIHPRHDKGSIIEVIDRSLVNQDLTPVMPKLTGEEPELIEAHVVEDDGSEE